MMRIGIVQSTTRADCDVYRDSLKTTRETVMCIGID